MQLQQQLCIAPCITKESLHASRACHTSVADNMHVWVSLCIVCIHPMQLLSVYVTRSLEEQRRLLAELYDKDAIYENNVTLLRGRDEIIKRFALLPVSTTSVKTEYEKPLVLGATTSA